MTIRKASLFLGVGAAGMVVDATVFFTVTNWFQSSFTTGRLLASVVALTATWWLNRSLAFREGRQPNVLLEYARYFAASSAGALANLSASYPISLHDERFSHIPAYIIGTFAGLVVNYLLYDRLVFAAGRKNSISKKAGTP